MLQDITKRILNGEITSDNAVIKCIDGNFEMSIDFSYPPYGMCKVGNFLEAVLHFSPHTGEFSDNMSYAEFIKCIPFSTIGSDSNIYRPDIITLNIKNNITAEKFDEFIDNGGYSLVYNQQQWIKWLNTPNNAPTIRSAEYIQSIKDKEIDLPDNEKSHVVYKNVNYLFDIEVDDEEINKLNAIVSDYMLPNTYIKLEQFYLIYAKFYNLDYSELPCVKFIEVFDYIEARLQAKKDMYDEKIKDAGDAAKSEEPVGQSAE